MLLLNVIIRSFLWLVVLAAAKVSIGTDLVIWGIRRGHSDDVASAHGADLGLHEPFAETGFVKYM